jgi:cytochrome c-type biogenesis protein CcmH
MRRRNFLLLPVAVFTAMLAVLPVTLGILPPMGATLAQVAPEELEEVLPDPAQEVRARTLMKEVRCVVCQSQAIDESDAGVAGDMRRLIREQVAAGRTDREILDYLAARYGDFVLFRPPFKAKTALLWLGPLLFLGAGAMVLVFFFRQRRSETPPAILSLEERQRVALALRGDAGNSSGAGHGSGPDDEDPR